MGPNLNLAAMNGNARNKKIKIHNSEIWKQGMKLKSLSCFEPTYIRKFAISRNFVAVQILMKIDQTKTKFKAQVRAILDPWVRGFLCRLMHLEALESLKSGRFCVDGSFFAESETGR